MSNKTVTLELVDRKTGEVLERMDITGWGFAVVDQWAELRLAASNFARATVELDYGGRAVLWNRWDGFEKPEKAFLGPMSAASTHPENVSKKDENFDMSTPTPRERE